MPSPASRRKALSGPAAGAATLLGTAGTARADVGHDDSPRAGFGPGPARGAVAAVAFAGFRVVRALSGTPAGADRGTIQVWSHITGAETGEYLKYEHNDPDRVAGPWTTVPWPAGAVRAAPTWVLATHEILQDAGLTARARERGHLLAVMGFQTSNTLHADNPPHRHMAYYPGPDMSAPEQTVPHCVVRNTRRF